MSSLIDVFRESLVITGFVFVMMLLIEYVNVLTQGIWQKAIRQSRWRQYLIAVVLGATPGCLGAFAVVAMFAHGVVGLGALVAAMIATSGDEAFVMFAMMPEQAFILTSTLIVLALIVGPLTDRLAVRFGGRVHALCADLTIHDAEPCDCFPGRRILQQWANLSLSRATLSLLLLALLIGVCLGRIGPEQWNWMRITILMATLTAGFVVATVPEHFLQSHLWEHVARKHVLRVFLWTFGALLLTHLLTERLAVMDLIRHNPWTTLLFASLLGIIPESGPHLVFVTLYAKAAIPFAILLASSVVQDGHGMLPLLGHSRMVFVIVKAINLAVGLAVGAVALTVYRG